jgi:hypothetical protein
MDGFTLATTLRLTSLLGLLALGVLGGCARPERVSSPTTHAGQIRPIRIEPSFKDDGLTLSASTTLSGLASSDAVVQLTAVGRPSATCSTAGGAAEPPRQVPDQVALSATRTIPASAIQDGTARVALTTGAPPAEIADAPGCSGDGATEKVDGLALESAVITVEQGGAIVLTLTCSFAAPPADGPVAPGGMICTSS